MLKFVICEDNEEFAKKVKFIIDKVMIPYDYDYRALHFKECDKKLAQIITDTTEPKIYILDIQLPKLSGVEIAERIRKYDWKSIIIMLTAFNEYKNDIFAKRVMVLDYIDKRKYEKTLEDTLKKALAIVNEEKYLYFKFDNVLQRVAHNDILYVKAALNKKSIIVCRKGVEYEVNKPLYRLHEELKPHFYKAHKSYLVNVNNIKSVNTAINTVTFKNGVSEPLMSNRLKKGLAEYVKRF